ncbi:MAG: O-antigen ligase family protein [Clostridia bacterium]|nr:O-antigen ligase family protein [Clostridia bacterium]
MGISFEKIKRCKVLDIIKKIISSKFLPFATAAVLLFCYYLGLDIVAMYYLGIVTILILLLLDDITPLVSHISFMTLVVSLKNTPSPSMGGSDYYASTAILAQIIIIVSLMVCSLIYRLVICCLKKKIKINPIFYGLCFLAFAFMLNGLFSEEYTVKDLLYGVVMAACFLVIYVAVKDNVKTDKNCFERIAFGFIALSALLIIELIVAYATTENLFVDGEINRGALIFGWGVYNTYGLLILMCIPATLYLAGKMKHGYLFTLYSLLILAATFLSCSRQAMIGALIIYPVSLVILLVKGKYRIPNLCITAAAVVAGIVLICIFREKFVTAFKTIFDNVVVNGELNGSGRWRIWKEAFKYFNSSPLFGSGFYVDYNYDGSAGVTFIPMMCHNTVLQLLASCGAVGLIAYLIHRVQTVISFCKNVTIERTFIALTILPILLLSLLDVHIFIIFPTVIYSCLLAVLIKSEEKTPEDAGEVKDTK